MGNSIDLLSVKKAYGHLRKFNFRDDREALCPCKRLNLALAGVWVCGPAEKPKMHH
jgi:hypothetical protein